MRLWRINRIRTIRWSLAIEGNTLSEEQVTAILEGKLEVAPPREIQEARNAIKIYDRLEQLDPGRESDLLSAHEIMMLGLVDFPGRYRSGGVGVISGNKVIHAAPPASQVPALMHDLFAWLNHSEHHPLVTSSIFHYEFEFIHPFTDGNGRLGWLWQTLILARWDHIFAFTPVESMVHAHQQEYYNALTQSTEMTDSAPFVEFMLGMIIEVLENNSSDQVSDQVKRLLRFLGEQFISVPEMMSGLSLSHRPTFRKNYLQPALKAGLLEIKYPENLKHPRQRYRLTAKDRRVKVLRGTMHN